MCSCVVVCAGGVRAGCGTTTGSGGGGGVATGLGGVRVGCGPATGRRAARTYEVWESSWVAISFSSFNMLFYYCV